MYQGGAPDEQEVNTTTMDDYDGRSWYSEEQLKSSCEQWSRRDIYEAEVKDDYEGISWYMSEEKLKLSCEQWRRRANNINESNNNDLEDFCYPIIFKDGTRQRLEFRPQFVYIQARLGQDNMNEVRNSNDMLRQRCDTKNGPEQKEFKHKIRTTHYRIGEASNPGPGKTNSACKQTKIGDYYNHIHTQKDDKDMWCKEKGYSIENIAGDGNCPICMFGEKPEAIRR